ncbi:MAG: radical SAM protein, partial [Dysgonamonadaceae bacterium]|nr:radical SAM protein [Dysgonamonadaceae bacterium]
MELLLIYPKWEKLPRQTTFNLPPHGPVVFAAALPEYVKVEFVDENVEEINFAANCDLVAISMMLSTQVKRGWEIADKFRARGKKVIFGGISTMLHAEDTIEHADSVFLGEAEGRMEAVLADFRNGTLKKVYNFMLQHPPIESVGPARRDLYKSDLYNYKGVQMVDLFHASRG